MPWTFGLLGASIVPLSAYELIQTQTVSSTVSSVTFSNISQNYKHLEVRYRIRSAAAIIRQFAIQFNGDTGTSTYYSHYLRSNGQSQFGGTNSTTQLILGFGQGGDFNAGAYGGGLSQILDYSSTTKTKTVMSQAGAMDPNGSQTYRVELTSGSWNNTAAISSVTVLFPGDSIVSGCRFSLYGIRA